MFSWEVSKSEEDGNRVSWVPLKHFFSIQRDIYFNLAAPNSISGCMQLCHLERRVPEHWAEAFGSLEVGV